MKPRQTVQHMKAEGKIMKYKIAEKFISINGEGEKAGQLAVFIRFAGCNLRCGYCDTMWANKQDLEFRFMDEEEIYEYIKSTGIQNVTLTGGEPLIQAGMKELLEILCDDMELRIEVETNGSMDISGFMDIGINPPVFTLDCKLKSSGMEGHMEERNYSMLKPRDTVKFVAGSIEELEAAKAIIERHKLTARCNVHFSPVFGALDMNEIVEFMKNNKINGVRLQPQLHKIIWHSERRGV